MPGRTLGEPQLLPATSLVNPPANTATEPFATAVAASFFRDAQPRGQAPPIAPDVPHVHDGGVLGSRRVFLVLRELAPAEEHKARRWQRDRRQEAPRRRQWRWCGIECARLAVENVDGARLPRRRATAKERLSEAGRAHVLASIKVARNGESQRRASAFVAEVEDVHRIRRIASRIAATGEDDEITDRCCGQARPWDREREVQP